MMTVINDRERRSKVHAALGEPTRLAIIDELSLSDRAPDELAAQLGLPGNLLAHHLDVLEHAGLVVRFESSGDRRRRYVRLEREPLLTLGLPGVAVPARVLFVCSHNSARSQIAVCDVAGPNRHDGVIGGDAPGQNMSTQRRSLLQLGPVSICRRRLRAWSDLSMRVCRS